MNVASAADILGAEMPETAIVDVNHFDGDQRANRFGLEIAKLHLEAGKKFVILTSFESEESLRKDDRFVLLLARPNVTFLRLPVPLDDYRKAYQSLKQK